MAKPLPDTAALTGSERAADLTTPAAAVAINPGAAGSTVPDAVETFTDNELPLDFLDRIVAGNALAFTLPDGRKASGGIEMIQRDAHGIEWVQGRLTLPQPGSYFFRRQIIPGVAGPLVGNVRFDGKQDGWKIEPAGASGAPHMLARKLDEIICANYAAAPPAAAAAGGEVANAPQTHPTNMPIPPYQTVIPLQSLPGATAVIYLDFDGETGPFAGWGDFNAAPSGANNDQVFDVWRMVCEDYMSFNINITTDRKVFDTAPQGRRQHCVITPTNNASPGSGGVAFVGSYNWGGDTVCWVFMSAGKNSADAIAHEVGHTLGLSHDGTTTGAEYYAGQGSGVTGWAPVMGVGYYESLTQWSKGEYLNANNTQDDLSIIAYNNNNTGYRPDDTGDTLATARYLEIASDNTVANEGIIETTGDIDAFRFVTTGGLATLNVNPASLSPDLDIQAEIVNAATSVVVVSDNPDLALNAAVSANLAAGEYLLRVRGVGRGNPLVDGYTNYGSLGSYLISGSVVGGVKSQRFTIVENRSNGSAVGSVVPRNNHGAASFAYAITSGNTHGAFAINPATGAITVANGVALNYEALSLRWDDPATFEMFVTITDAANPSLNENLRTVVTVANVNEAPSATGGTATLVEHTPVGTNVFQVPASDPDRFDFVSYSIAGGNIANVFAIDANTGQITVAADIAVAADTVYHLSVQVTDQGTPALSTFVNVDITVSKVAGGAPTAPIRIMPLGDSITYGAAGRYRNKLYQTLTAAGYNVDFIGTQTGGGVATLPDSNHEGHGGWTIGQLDANVGSWFGLLEDPDVILLHIGTNDFGLNVDPASAINRLDALITKMATLRPYAHIIVTNLLERNEPYNTSIQTQFNPFVQAKVNAQAALGRRVTFLDMRSAVPLSETVDQLHPNQTGNDHMADAWLPAIQAVIGTQGDSATPAIVRALANADQTHVAITFSKPVADSAARVQNFALNGGLTVSAAALSASKRVVTLTTSQQTLVGNYTVTLNGIVDRTPAALPLPANSAADFNATTVIPIGNANFNDSFPFDSLITTDAATGLGAPWCRAAADWVVISYNAWMNPANTDGGQLLSQGARAYQVLATTYAAGTYRLSADLATSFNDGGTAVLSLVDAVTGTVLATQAWHYGPGEAGGDQYHWAYDQGLGLTVTEGNAAIGHPIRIVLSGGTGFSEYENIALNFIPSATSITIGNPGFNNDFPFDSLITTNPASGLGAPWCRAAADWVVIAPNAWMNPANTDRGQLLSTGGAATQVLAATYTAGSYRLSADLATSFNDGGTAVLSLVDAATGSVLATQAWHYGPGEAGGDQYHWAYDQGLGLTVAAGNPAIGHQIKIVLSGGSGYSEYDNIALHFNPPATAIAIGNAGFNNDWGTDSLITTDPAAGFGAPWFRTGADWVDIAPSAWMNPANTDRGQLLSQGRPAYQILTDRYTAGTYRLAADLATSFNDGGTATLSLVDAANGNVLATQAWHYDLGESGGDQYHWAYNQGLSLTVAAGDAAIGHPIEIVLSGGTGNSEYDNIALTFTVPIVTFNTWAGTTHGLSGPAAAFDADPDHDGIPNGVEFVIGGQPNPARPSSNSSALLPTVASAGANLVFRYTRMNEAAYLNPLVEFNTGLSGTWTTAVNGVNATIVVTPGATAATVTVTIPKGAANQMFARLKVTQP